jgi:hypothetical protein
MATYNLKICRLKEFPSVILVGAIFFVITWSAVWMLRAPSSALAASRNAARITYNVEREHIRATLKETKWILSGPRGAATRLGNRSTLYFRPEEA